MKNKKTFKEANFGLSKEELQNIAKQNCYYCGVEPKPNIENKKHSYHGVDMLDHMMVNTPGNIVSCCSTCQIAKGAMDLDQFKKVIKRTYINLFRKMSDKTPGELIDSLITVDIKCFMFQEKQNNPELSDAEKVKVCEVILELNKKRNKLMRSIDVLFDFQEDMMTPKTYLQGSKEDEKPEF